MLLKDFINKENISLYKLSKDTSIPYSTLRDLYTNKTPLSKASGEVIYKISSSLNVSMEDLLSSYMMKRPSFENFKSETCQRLHSMGDIPFIIELLESDLIHEYYSNEWYPEALYLLAMLDYLCKENNIPLCTDYNTLRKAKLTDTVFPASVVALAEATNNTDYYTDAINNSIPEFLRFNIVESDVRDVN